MSACASKRHKREIRTSSGRGGVISASCQDRAGRRIPPDAGCAAVARQGGLPPHPMLDESPPPSGGIDRAAPERSVGKRDDGKGRHETSGLRDEHKMLSSSTRCSRRVQGALVEYKVAREDMKLRGFATSTRCSRRVQGALVSSTTPGEQFQQRRNQTAPRMLFKRLPLPRPLLDHHSHRGI